MAHELRISYWILFCLKTNAERGRRLADPGYVFYYPTVYSAFKIIPSDTRMSNYIWFKEYASKSSEVPLEIVHKISLKPR